MHRLLTLALIVTAVVGLLVWQVSGESGAAPPCGNPNPPSPCTPTPTANASPTATATATPPPTSAPTPTATESPPVQAREDQITIFADGTAGSVGSYGPSDYFLTDAAFIALDPFDYPANTTFHFEATFHALAPDICERLFDATAGVAVSGSEVCHSFGGPTRLRTGSVQVATAEHDYRVQFRCVSCSGSDWTSARIIAEWTE
jgi:hypothetical protein